MPEETRETPAAPDTSVDDRAGKCHYRFHDKFICDRPTKPGQDLCVCHRMERTPEEEEEFLAEVEKVMDDGKKNAVYAAYDLRGFRFPKEFLHFLDEKLPGHVFLQDAVFKGDLLFDGTEITGDLWLQDTRVDGQCSFFKTTIGGDAWILSTSISSKANFLNTVFGGMASFADMTVHGSTSFQGAHFNAATSFVKVSFGYGVEFHSATLPPGGTFRDITVSPGRGESLYRFAKQVCQNMGEYREAGDWHVKERRDAWYTKRAKCAVDTLNFLRHYRWLRWLARRRIALFVAHVRAWPEAFVLDGIFGYGERPRQVGAAALVIIFTWTLYYRIAGAVYDTATSRAADIWGCLYFSLVTFTTLGFGDLRPLPVSAYRLMAGFEAVAGAFLMAAFLVTLARRWGRG